MNARVLSVVAAVVAALAVWVVADPVLGIDLEVGAQTVGPVAVVVVAALAGLAAWGVVTLLERTVHPPILHLSRSTSGNSLR